MRASAPMVGSGAASGLARFARLLSSVLGLACVAAGLTSCSDTGAEEHRQQVVDEVKIGLLAPMTGPHALDGNAAVQGAQLAAEVVNSDLPSLPLPLAGGSGLSGLGGVPVRVLAVDTRSDPDHGSDEAVELATRNGVAGLVGAYDADVTQLASQRTERDGVPWISGDTSARYLTDLGMDWFFRVGPSDRTFGAAFFSLLRQQAGKLAGRKLAVVRVDDEASNDIFGVVKQLADQSGFPVELDVAVGGDGSAFSAAAENAVDRVRKGRPGVVLLIASSSQDATGLERAFRAADYTPPALMTLGPGFSSASFEQALATGTGTGAGSGGNGWLASSAWSAEVAKRHPAARAVAEAYQEKFNTAMTAAAASSFTAVLTLAQAIQNAGSVRHTRVRAALLALNIPGSQTIMPWHGIKFDENRQNTLAAAVIEQRAGRGERVVFPGELARTAVTWAPAGGPEPRGSVAGGPKPGGEKPDGTEPDRPKPDQSDR